MEDLWRYTEAQQGHRKVRRGQCWKEELGQGSGAQSLVGQAGPSGGPGLDVVGLCSESALPREQNSL